MQRGLNKKLRAGTPRVNADLSVDVLGTDGQVIHAISPAALTGGGIGFVYERIVGLHYEALGYVVDYRSRLGYRDAGVDLVARRDAETRFVQCKCTLHRISPAAVEQLLYAASEFVLKNLAPGENRFDLVVPFVERTFPAPPPGARTLRNKAKDVFLRYNRTQHQVVLDVVEVPFPMPMPPG